MTIKLTLVSHLLCPYVQRAAIVLAEKGIDFERINIDLANKPDWFLKISPLGKTPVLLVNGKPIFESAVICEYLEETTVNPLHPRDARLRRGVRRCVATVRFRPAESRCRCGGVGGLPRGSSTSRRRIGRQIHRPTCRSSHRRPLPLRLRRAAGTSGGRR